MVAEDGRTREQREARAAEDDGDPADTVYRSVGNTRRYYHDTDDPEQCSNLPAETYPIERATAQAAGMGPCKLCVLGDGGYDAPDEDEQCVHVKDDGERCEMPASIGEYCPKHFDFDAVEVVADD